ncbi:MAG: carboxypeptidase-like regulatory domain-containing protein [Chitinophagaceae bacterium]|nr:carboxypeptidase-like regulatory domain-containing protein [Chitinophagaceae bacterium]MCW5927855.1 carboxypeptidase-like regulatory domain-containing protein [Chitinophagaceae bacterium]
MKHLLRYILIFFVVSPFAANAQFESLKDSVVMLYGIVMTHDSLKGIPDVSVMIKGQNRGTKTNMQGVFSIVVLKGDEIEFSHVSYRKESDLIPAELEGNQFSMVKLLSADTVYLPVMVIKPRPTREQFERDFVNTNVPDDDIEIARQNTNEAVRTALMRSMPRDGGEATNYALSKNARSYYYSGQAPPMNIFNPFAWNEFVKAWKRGDFKKK